MDEYDCRVIDKVMQKKLDNWRECQEHQVQNCHDCLNLDCGDNMDKRGSE